MRGLALLDAIRAVWWREVRRTLTDRGQLVGGVSRPVLWVIVLGIGLNPWFRGETYGDLRFVVPFTYLQFIFPAVVVLNILYAAIQSASSLIWDRKFGFLRELLVSPMPRTAILLAKVLAGTTIAVVHGCLVLAISRIAGVSLGWDTLLMALALMAALGFAATCLGIVLAISLREFESFGVFSNAVILPLYFTAGSVFPIDPSFSRAQTLMTYPAWLVTVVEANPLTYAVDTMRGVLIGWQEHAAWIGPTVIGTSVIVLFALAAYRFSRL
ncbi:ABC transporter [Salipiger sp. IMCC34102]|uniref:ABC transporter permease n=1 Tax=Salipiger sp. IMCC34102 TaxID=2510647 RepID=UPI00101BEB79|nr:ABC transporter permease [Salipiger sp. IMCC34102]RYH04451.1 ABC transporter [Salipiger sp. IMCC34102]